MDKTDVGSKHCRVTPITLGADFSQRIQFFRHYFAYVEVAKRIAPQAHILEIGSGEGYGADYLANQHKKFVAIDLSSQALKHTAQCYTGIEFCQAVGTGLPFVASSFDVVVSFQVIEHIESDTDYVREVYRILKPNGLFILTTPNRKWRLLPFQKPWNPYHVREYSHNRLYRLLKEIFDDVQLYSIVAPPDIMKVIKVKQNPVKVYGVMIKRCLMSILPLHYRWWNKLKWSLLFPETKISKSSTTSLIIQRQYVELKDFFLSVDASQGMDFFAISEKSKR